MAWYVPYSSSHLPYELMTYLHSFSGFLVSSARCPLRQFCAALLLQMSVHAFFWFEFLIVRGSVHLICSSSALISGPIFALFQRLQSVTVTLLLGTLFGFYK